VCVRPGRRTHLHNCMPLPTISQQAKLTCGSCTALCSHVVGSAVSTGTLQFPPTGFHTAPPGGNAPIAGTASSTKIMVPRIVRGNAIRS
jgi:hypothetical protein